MNTTIDHSDKRVIVAGTGQPLAAAIADAFRSHGAHVVQCTQASPRPALGIVGDSQRGVNDAVQKLGGLDVFVSFMGIESAASIETATPETWDQGCGRPLKSTFFATQAALPALVESRGAIVNVASIIGLMGARDGLAIPAAAMACVVHQTRMLALRLGTAGVRVNCVCHGYMSELEGLGVSAASTTGSVAAWTSGIPMARLTRDTDILPSVLFLASPLAGFVTGAIVTVDGGTFAGS